MTAGVIVVALCACSWTGHASSKSPCPACSRSWHDRITPERLAILRRVHADPRAHIQPAMRIRLREMGVLVAAEPSRKGGGDGRRKPACRAHRITEQGQLVLEVARIADQTRHDVAAAAARHAEIDP